MLYVDIDNAFSQITEHKHCFVEIKTCPSEESLDIESTRLNQLYDDAINSSRAFDPWLTVL